MDKTLHINVPITKVDDERREVWGYATTEDVDSHDEVVDYGASKKAFKSWVGNIREMHDETRAIGKAIRVQFDEARKGVFIGAKISRSADGENAWQKVKEGILQGFSIGGVVEKLQKETVKAKDGIEKEVNRIVEYSLGETSLVDNPANPGAELVMVKSMDGELQRVEGLQRRSDPRPYPYWLKFIARPIENPDSAYNDSETLHKRQFSAEERERLAEEGKAMPDGSFPIVTVGDLKNAINAWGRSKNQGAVKRHIIKRAKALGRTDLLPDDWKTSDKSITGGTMSKETKKDDTPADDSPEETPADQPADDSADSDGADKPADDAKPDSGDDDAGADDDDDDDDGDEDAPADDDDKSKPKQTDDDDGADDKGDDSKKKSSEVSTLLKSVSKRLEKIESGETRELTKTLGKMSKVLGSLDDRLSKLEKTAAPTKVRAPYADVKKDGDEDEGEEEVKKFKKDQDALMKQGVNADPMEVAKLAERGRKLQLQGKLTTKGDDEEEDK